MKEHVVLKGIMVMNKITEKELAEKLGISTRSMYNKLNGITDFRLQEEAKIIADFFNTTVDNIFFNEVCFNLKQTSNRK